MNNTLAFPSFQFHQGYGQMLPVGGADLRDYFAAKALQGILTDAEIAMGISEIAELAYKYADAMMKAREA
jgi:hypothetical protein